MIVTMEDSPTLPDHQEIRVRLNASDGNKYGYNQIIPNEIAEGCNLPRVIKSMKDKVWQSVIDNLLKEKD